MHREEKRYPIWCIGAIALLVFLGCGQKDPEFSYGLLPPETRRVYSLVHSDESRDMLELVFQFPSALKADGIFIQINGILVIPTHLGMRSFYTRDTGSNWTYSQAVKINDTIDGFINVPGRAPFPFHIDNPDEIAKESGKRHAFWIEVYENGSDMSLYSGTEPRSDTELSNPHSAFGKP